MGRSTAFNATLFFTSIFGLMASFATSFVSLCVLLFFLGSAVGVSHFPQTPQPITHPNFKGSMPTDGTLLLEHMPKGKQYLVTALSVFFSFGDFHPVPNSLLTYSPLVSPPPSTLPYDFSS